jgi:hypothetical protein
MPASDSKLFLTGCMGGFWIYACTSGENADSGVVTTHYPSKTPL